MGKKRKKAAESMASSSSAPPSPSWVDLPLDITTNILERLGAEEKLAASLVCTTWRSVCKDPSFWRKIHISRDPSRRRVDYEMMCRHAVDRSQGQLLDLSISGFGSNSLLKHIAERSVILEASFDPILSSFIRSNGIRFLSLTMCDKITGVAGVDATDQGLRLLEERFSCTSELSGFMGLIYHSFPSLNSLTLNWTMVGRRARSLDKIMDQVCYLRVMGMSLCKLFLVPLFKACAHLKSLNLELGFDLSISRNMANLVFEDIKDQQPSLPLRGRVCDSGFHGDYKMHFRGSTCVRVSLVYAV